MSETYELGESVVHRCSKKMGKVVDAADSTEDGTTETVKIQFEDGLTEWHSVSEVSRMLYEVDPTSDKTLFDRYPIYSASYDSTSLAGIDTYYTSLYPGASGVGQEPIGIQLFHV